MFDRTEDQQLFEETTRKFLAAQSPLTKVRALAGTKAGFEPDFWRRGAELGWTSLVVPEAAGGGSVSGDGVLDLVLVAYEFGLQAAPGPLGPTNLVAAALGRWGTGAQHAGPLAALLAGERTAAWACGSIDARVDGETIALRGRSGPVEAGTEAADVLVTARTVGGTALYLVPGDASGLTATPLQGLDMTRRFARLDFDGVRVPTGGVVAEGAAADGAVAWLEDLGALLGVAEIVGCMQWAMDTTLDWAFHRYSFGRPLASYQEIKHRFADMKMWLEGSYAISARAAHTVEDDSADRSEVVSAAKYYVGLHGAEMLQDCVQLHGGIGVTFDHDLHLFLRRVTSNVPAFGAPAEHAARLGGLVHASATSPVATAS